MKTKNLLEMIDMLDIQLCFISKDTHGSFNTKTNKIKLNVETMVVEVFVHELMHLLHPILNQSKDEDVIDEMTARVWKKLTQEQIRAMAKRLLARRSK